MFAITSAKSLRIAVAVAALSLSSVPAIADVAVTIDGTKNCLDTNSGNFPFGGFAKPTVAPGIYMVELRDNSMSCQNGIVSGTCLINHVILRVPASVSAGWGVSVGEPVVLDLTTTTAPTMTAFVIDNGCYDNAGKATLYFKGPL